MILLFVFVGVFMGMGTSRRPGTGSNDSVFTTVVF